MLRHSYDNCKINHRQCHNWRIYIRLAIDLNTIIWEQIIRYFVNRSPGYNLFQFVLKLWFITTRTTFHLNWITATLVDRSHIQQGSRYKPLRLSTLFDTTLWKDIYGPLQAERSIKFFGYDPQISHNTPLIMSAAMFTYAQRITK